jgi:hypothetical protein
MLGLLLVLACILTWASGGYNAHKVLFWSTVTCNFASSLFCQLHRTGQRDLKPSVLKVLDVLLLTFLCAFLVLFVWLMVVLWR